MSSLLGALIGAYTVMMVIVIGFVFMRMNISWLKIGLHDITVLHFSLSTISKKYYIGKANKNLIILQMISFKLNLNTLKY